MMTDQTTERTDSEETEMRACEHCGEEFPADSGVNGSGSVNTDNLKQLLGGESVAVDELFAFDEPYCSIDCASAGGEDGE